MGRYRAILAALVVISHCGITIFGYNPGVVAVISFYILSGYVMALLISRHYATPQRIVPFYIDRVARLFPQFLFYFGVTLVFYFGSAVRTEWLSNVTLTKFALNIPIIPLNFYMPEALDLGQSMFLPQAWSLGLEMSFYLVIPFLMFRTNPIVPRLIAFLSGIVFLFAVLGAINSDYFGYRLLPGTLFIFMTGMFLAKRDKGSSAMVVVTFLCVLVAFFAIHASALNLHLLPYNKEVLLGIIIGIISVSILRNVRHSDVDEFVGNISYGLFLNHFIVIWLAQSQFSIEKFSYWQASAVVAVGSLLAIVSYRYVERPAIAWRRKVRYSGSNAS